MMSHPQAAGLDAGAANGLKLLLADHHRELEKVCHALLASAREDCSRSLIEQYRVLEHALLEHFDVEEAVLLPDFAAYDPEGARTIRDEHEAIRELLLQVAVDVELHAARLERLQRLIEMLHAHAAREDAVMYPWAQVHLSRSAKQRLFVKIRRLLGGAPIAADPAGAAAR
jgi:iron-sulfur cluster repair protein YtfE (RIC family)